MKWLAVFAIIVSLMASESFSPDVEGAQNFNAALRGLKLELKEQFSRIEHITDEEEQKHLLAQVDQTRKKIRDLEESWRQGSLNELARVDEPYAMWDVGETTLSQLVMEYGSSDFLYVIPQEVGAMKISLFSGIPLPQESWSEMIEMILMQNGIGVKKINPFVKQLYILKLDPASVEAILAKEEELTLFDPNARLCFVLSPPSEQIKSAQSFFEKFSDPKQTSIQAIGSKITMVSTKATLEKLLGLYHTVWARGQGKVVRVVSSFKISPEEAEKILKAVFSEGAIKTRPSYFISNAGELTTFIIPQGLVLVGEEETVRRGETILNEVEAQLEDPSEKIIYWYACKHSNPEDIAAVLDQVYDSLMGANLEKGKTASKAYEPQSPSKTSSSSKETEAPGSLPYLSPGPGFNPVLPATAPFIQPSPFEKEKKTVFGNFIVDSKTTSILMVVKKEELAKIKTLLKKLDVPKKMVQLDVLLVEKKFRDNQEIGFSLLQLGTNSSGKKETAINYATSRESSHFSNGLFSFIFSRPSGKFPAADMKFNFLLAQENVRIKANPSILAVNQTQAQISIVEEISINNGAFPFNSPTGTIIQDSYTRAQYGITINLTPTIHASEEENGPGFVFLETDLEFDTTTIISQDDRPPVTRRNIQNQVRVQDGETIILGGLRQQIEEDNREKIPFLGDLPGIGKLFGTARSRDISTEMFIFITPRIIRDPSEDLRLIMIEEYSKRPGDTLEFLERIDEAKNFERKCLFKQSLKLLFDKV